MLRSYQYTEKSYLESSAQLDSVFQQELEMIRHFSLDHPSPANGKTVCPMCAADDADLFYEKWKTKYVRCRQCKTVYAVVSPEDLRDYLHWDDLRSFRMDPHYQEVVKINRQNSWKEYLEWIEVRSFRFLGKNKGLHIFDVGNRWKGFSELIRSTEICASYDNPDVDLLIDPAYHPNEKADLIFYNDSLKTEGNPQKTVSALRTLLSDNGIMVIGARAGSGFDVLTLKGNNDRIAPFEHILLPSVKGLTVFLNQNGFEILEITTPGVMDVSYVMDNLSAIGDHELFVQELLSDGKDIILQEFQRFLQKSCMSSLVRVIAKKKEGS